MLDKVDEIRVYSSMVQARQDIAMDVWWSSESVESGSLVFYCHGRINFREEGRT